MDLKPEIWKELVRNRDVFNLDSSIVLSRMIELCESQGSVTFADLCNPPYGYGGYEKYYERESVRLAKRIYKYLEIKNLERPSRPANNEQWLELIYEREIRDGQNAWCVKPKLSEVFEDIGRNDPERIRGKGENSENYNYIQHTINFLKPKDSAGNSEVREQKTATISEIFKNSIFEDSKGAASNAVSFCCATKPDKPGDARHPNYFYTEKNTEKKGTYGLTGYLNYEETKHDKRHPEKDWGEDDTREKDLIKKIRNDPSFPGIDSLERNKRCSPPHFIQYIPREEYLRELFKSNSIHYEILYKCESDTFHELGNIYIELHHESGHDQPLLKKLLEEKPVAELTEIWHLKEEKPNINSFFVRLQSGNVHLQTENGAVKDDNEILDEIRNALAELYNTLNDDVIKGLNFRIENDVKDLLLANQQIILNGPPGTGKTFIADKVAETLIKENDEPCNFTGMKKDYYVRSVQFHPGYDYSDFIVGLKPKLIKDSSCDGTEGKKVLLSYEWKDGVFKEFADRVWNDYDKWVKTHERSEKPEPNKFVFIIDEINRADLSNVFGEAFSRLEKDYRGKPVKLPNGVELIVPPNFYIIGTMNDIDRSVESIDFALRRRFSWYEVTADVSRRIIREKVKDEKLRDRLVMAMDAVNELICDPKMGLGAEYQLGGAYFVGLEEKGVENCDEYLCRLWKYHIQVILNDYLRGRKDRKKLLEKFEDKFFDRE